MGTVCNLYALLYYHMAKTSDKHLLMGLIGESFLFFLPENNTIFWITLRQFLIGETFDIYCKLYDMQTRSFIA